MTPGQKLACWFKKNIATVIWSAIVILVIGGCSVLSRNTYNKAQAAHKRLFANYHVFYQDLAAPHQLRKLFDYAKHEKGKESGWNADGGFFLIAGSFSANGQSKEWDLRTQRVMFAWESKGVYTISDLPLTKVKVKIDETITQPYVQLFLRSAGSPEEMESWMRVATEDSETIFNKAVAYAVVTVRSRDWPREIQAPLNDIAAFKEAQKQ